MKKIYLLFFTCCILSDFLVAQTYTDGSTNVQLTVYQVWRRTYGDAGFGNSEDSYRIQLRDNANHDGSGFLPTTNTSDGNNGWCFHGGGVSSSYPRTETPNRLALNYTYTSNNPMYYDIDYDTWEDDRGDRCAYNGPCTFCDSDDDRCGPGTITSLPIRSLGAPCVNNSAGWQYFCGSGSSNSTAALIQARYSTPVPQTSLTNNPCDAVINSSINGAGSYSGCTYTWERNGVGTVANTQNLTTSVAGLYRVTYNCNGCSNVSSWVTVSAPGSAPSAGTISGTQTSCSGATPSVLGSTSAASGTGTLTYQWQQSTTDCSSGWTNISGATGLTYQPPVLTQTTYYRRAVTDCWGRTSYTACVTVTVNPLPTAISPTITTSLPLCYGGNAQIQINPSQTGVAYQLFDGVSLVGTAVNGTGGAIQLYTPNLTAASNNFQVISTVTASTCTSNVSLASAITVSGPPTTLANHGDSRTCYVNGNNSYVQFAVGTRGIAAINPGLQNLGNVTITEYVNGTPINTQACNTSAVNQPQFTTAALNRHWLITSTVAPVSPSDIRLYINGADVTALATVANANANPNDDVAGIASLELSKYSGPFENDQWNDNCTGLTTLHFQNANGAASGAIVGGTGITAGQYLTFTIPNFSELWLSGTSNISPLPIVLGKFEAECNSTKIDLKWTTLTESNNDKFIIERSANGTDWAEILWVNGAGNSNQPLNYQSSDLHPIRGLSYYRLKQVDFNGSSETFAPLSITCLNNGENNILLFPNPATESFTIQFNSAKAYSHASIELIDMTGRTIGSQHLKIEKGNNSYVYSPLNFSAGTYTVRIKSQGETLIQAPLVIHKH